MSKCPDFPPSDLTAQASVVHAERELSWRVVVTPQLDIANALYVDNARMEQQKYEGNCLKDTLRILRESGMTEGDIAQYALDAMAITCIDRRDEI